MKLNQVSMKHLDMCNNDREEKHDFLAGNLNGISSKVMKNWKYSRSILQTITFLFGSWQLLVADT